MRRFGRKIAARYAPQSAHPVTEPETRYALILLCLKEAEEKTVSVQKAGEQGYIGLKTRKLMRLLEERGVFYGTARKLAQDLISLRKLGLVEASNPYGGPKSRRYFLTPEGHEAAEEIKAYMNRGAPREEYARYLENLFKRVVLRVM